MKTNQIMYRPMGQFQVVQRTSDGYFDANSLLLQWNKTPGNSQRKMDEFLLSPKTIEFIEEVETREKAIVGISPELDFKAVKVVKGKITNKGRTPNQVWLHPYIYIDFAMWINPKFKYDVIKFVYDELIRYRNEAGDAYKDMAAAIVKLRTPDMGSTMKKVAEALNFIVYGKHETNMRNKEADQDRLRELSELERDIAMLINEDFITNYDQLLSYLRKLWYKKNTPAILR